MIRVRTPHRGRSATVACGILASEVWAPLALVGTLSALASAHALAVQARAADDGVVIAGHGDEWHLRGTDARGPAGERP